MREVIAVANAQGIGLTEEDVRRTPTRPGHASLGASEDPMPCEDPATCKSSGQEPRGDAILAARVAAGTF